MKLTVILLLGAGLTASANGNAQVTLDLKNAPLETVFKEKHKDRSLGIEQWQYSDKVEFVQIIKMKVNAKTNISGNVEYQACTDEKCLPPKKVEFNVKLE